jgi:preprotein translocase subunit YajC
MTFATQAYAMAPQPATDGAPAPNPLLQFAPMIIIVVLFYFLLIRPQQKQAKERTKLINGAQADDKVITVGGVYATIVKVNEDDTLILRISDNTNVKVTRQAIDRLQK